MNIKVIAFDADDTLWHNEPYFQEMERRFGESLEDYVPQHTVSEELLKTEEKNVPLYGFGIKSFILSMIETTIRVTDRTAGLEVVESILGLGKEMLEKPVELLDGVEEVLASLKRKYRLVVVTKGDLLDQERKLKKSGLEGHFHHIEIMSEKREQDYHKLIGHLDVRPSEFAIIGNSLKSDIIPVLNLGGYGFHVHYHILWDLDKIEIDVNHKNFRSLKRIGEVMEYL